jgi:hypothetical protein
MKVNKKTKLAGIALIAALGIAALAGCNAVTTTNGESDADKVSENIALEAEAFQVQRSITATNGITGEILFVAEGRCSFEYPGDSGRVDAVCKYGPEEYRKHTFILGDQDQVVIAQEAPIDVSEYHTKIVIKPQNIIPELGLSVGEDK